MKVAKFTGAKWNATQHAARKAARAAAAAAHGTNANVKDRLDTIERALGIVPATQEKK